MNNKPENETTTTILTNQDEAEASTPRQEILTALQALIPAGAVAELRAMSTKRATQSGYYTDLAAMARDAARLSGRCPGVYFILNEINPELLARSENGLTEYAKNTTADVDITRRRYLLIDFDPKRPAGVSATEQEHSAAWEKLRTVYKFLKKQHGWERMFAADSGNGAHLLVAIDLPNDKNSKLLLERVLKALAFLFDDGVIQVDRTTFNAARICKLYGTLAKKGSSTEDRPHRQAQLLHLPKSQVPVTVEQLEAVAALLPEPEKPRDFVSSGSQDTFPLEAWLEENRVAVAQTGDWNGGKKYILSPCPWKPDHNDRAAYILQFPDGHIIAGCHHSGCAGKNWHDLRNMVEGDKQEGGEQGEGEDGEETQPLPYGWEEPRPLYEFNLPEFPTEALPDWLRRVVEAQAHATQTPVDLGAVISLAVVATAVQKKARIALNAGGWDEPLNIYAAVVLGPANRKSAVVSFLIRPIQVHQKKQESKQKQLIAEALAEKRVLEKRLQAAEKPPLTARAKPTTKLTRKLQDWPRKSRKQRSQASFGCWSRTALRRCWFH